MKTKLLSLLLIASLGFVISCKKKNDERYQAKGDYQPAGSYGNANSNVYKFSGLTWITIGTNAYQCTFNVPAITQSVIDNGAVLVYLTGDNGATWIALPMTASGVELFVAHSIGKVTLEADNGTSAPSASQFKVVVISAAQMKKMDGVDPRDLSAVENALQVNANF